MSDLLLHWLNNDLQLSTFVSNVEDDFASGYLLGELLQRLNQQHNLGDFMDSKIADAKIINFCLLEPTLRRLHVRFNSKIATAIMNGKRDAAANVLYQIKIATERVARAPPVSLRSEERANVRPLHNVPSTLAKPSFDAAHHYFFEHSVRHHVQSLSALQRERDAVEAETQRMRTYCEQQATIQEQLAATKAERLHQAFLHSQYIKTALDETDSPAWRLALAKKRERERRQALFYQQLLADKTRAQQTHTFSLRHTVERDLDEFERRGSSTTSPVAGNGGGNTRKSRGYGLRSLTTTLEHQSGGVHGCGLRDPSKPIPIGGEPTGEHGTTTATIRDQRHHRERRRDQFERRRKRFLQDALHTQTHTNASRIVQGLERLVGRATHREDESIQAMAKILVYKELATENRLRREARYTNRREMDAYETVDRDTAAWELLFAKYNDDWEIQSGQQAQRKIACSAALQYENRLVVGLVVHEVIAFAMVIAGKREDSVHARDAAAFLATEESWHELCFQFAERGVGASSLSQDDHSLLHHQLVEYLEQFLTPQFGNPYDYVGAVTNGSNSSPWLPSDWKFVAAVESLEDRFVLGETVKYLRWLDHADPPHDVEKIKPSTEMEASPPTGAAEAEEEETPVETKEPSTVEAASGDAVMDVLREPESSADAEVPPSPSELVTPDPEPMEVLPRLCILLAGPPFAGKTTQAQRLAERYNLALLSVEQRLQAALAEASVIGQEAHAFLTRGDQIPPHLYSRLVLDAIQQLDVKHTHRWILYDLPSTRAHAQSLEQHLTGFVEPSQVVSPFDFVSLLAPGVDKPPLPTAFLHGKSVIDLVFYLDCSEASVLERCLGTLEDRETHAQTYHLVFAPPPLDATDRHRLQHVNTTSNASPLLSLQCLSTQEMEQDAKNWFKRFETLRDITTTECQQGQSVAITRALTVDVTHERLVHHVDAFFNQQRTREIERQQEKERNETVAMQDEERRQCRLTELKTRLVSAQDELTKAQQSVQHAEDAKAKKEEIAELRSVVDAAKKLVEQALVDARDWRLEETVRVRHAQSMYSARLLPPLARVLASLWDAMESEYTLVMKQCLALQRQQRERVECRVQWLVASVCKYMRRCDAKQSLVNTFQSQFNEVLEDMRFDDATKHELHARVDILQDELCLATSTKNQESDRELDAIVADGWLDDTCQWIALSYQRMLQAECDRFRVSLQLLVDAFAAASDEPAQLTSVRDALKTNPHILAELTLQVFTDTNDDPAVAVATPAAATTGKPNGAKSAPAAKGKQPPLAPQASAVVVGGVSADTLAGSDPRAPETLLLAFDRVLQKSDALVELIVHAKPADAVPAVAAAAAIPPPSHPVGHGKAGAKTGATPVVTPTATPVASMALLPRQSIDVATSNFHKAVQYEHDLLARRVHFLKHAVQSACDHATRAMRTVETTLRDAIEQRCVREDAAVATLIVFIRTAIEAETDLPFYLQIQPDQVDRFPTTHHLVEDTRVTVDATRRLVARPPIDIVPTMEAVDPLCLNHRQARALRRKLLVDECTEESPVCSMTIGDVTSVLLALATEPHALPSLWQGADEPMLIKVVAAFADPPSGLVDTGKLVQAMKMGSAPLLLFSPYRQKKTEKEDGAIATSDA